MCVFSSTDVLLEVGRNLQGRVESWKGFSLQDRVASRFKILAAEVGILALVASPRSRCRIGANTGQASRKELIDCQHSYRIDLKDTLNALAIKIHGLILQQEINY